MLFIISVFGREDHPMWENKYRAYLAKVGLGISGCGALLNVLNLSTPNITEIVLNIGLSLNFCWLAWWQYSETKANQKKKFSKPELVLLKEEPVEKPVKQIKKKK